MKRIVAIIILIASLLLTSCSQQATPMSSDAEVATKVAQVMTNMPTVTAPAAKVITATPGLSTVTITPEPVEATKSAATVTGTAPAATVPPTQVPTQLTQVAPTATRPTATATQPAATVAPTATFIAGDPRTKLGNPSWTDKMNSGENWPTGGDPAGNTSIAFQNSFMELTSLKPTDGWRLTIDKLTNAYLELTVNSGTCLPKDRYGVVVRVPSTTDANRGYLLGFTCDGQYAIRKWDGTTKTMSNLINWKANPAIVAGANKTNRMGVMMQGSKLGLYANGTLVGEIQDDSWTSGYFGIFAGAHESSQYTLKVDEANYWKLP
jgi:hypothetical protein